MRTKIMDLGKTRKTKTQKTQLFSTMKLTKFIPKKLFKRKKPISIPRPVSVFNPSFSNSLTTSSSSSSPGFRKPVGSATAISVIKTITISELESLFCRLGAEPPTEEELKIMLSEIDRNGINIEKFFSISSEPVCADELREAFDFFDSDRDGKIMAEEPWPADMLQEERIGYGDYQKK